MDRQNPKSNNIPGSRPISNSSRKRASGSFNPQSQSNDIVSSSKRKPVSDTSAYGAKKRTEGNISSNSKGRVPTGNAASKGRAPAGMNSSTGKRQFSGALKQTKRRVPKKTKKKKTPLSIVGRIILTVFLVFVISGCLIGGVMAVYIFGYVDTSLDFELTNMNNLDYTSIIYVPDSDTGEYIEYQRLKSIQNRIWVNFDSMPLNLRNAFIAIEDQRFYEHNGVDWKRTTGAVFNMFAGSVESYGGGSTITQQLIKNLTEDDDVTPMRKIREIMRALELEKKYTKETILESYLNTIYLNNGNYGVETAANHFFNKSADELTLVECAALAAMTKEPAFYDPVDNPEGNKKRRNYVLEEMATQNLISQAELEEAKKEELVLVDPEDRPESTKENYSYFVDAIIDDVIDMLMSEGRAKIEATQMLYTKGYKIYATLDTEIQAKLDEIYVNQTDNTDIFTRLGDGVQPESAMVVMDYSGHVVAMAGGRGEKEGNRTWNYATMEARQPGSSIKPLAVYAPAIDQDVITYSTVYTDAPITKGSLTIKNYDGTYSGPMFVQDAVERSNNTVAVQVVDELSYDKSYEYLTEKLGFTTLNDSDRYSSPLALGAMTNGVTVKEITAAYAIFGNLGQYWKPVTYTKITDSNGDIVFEQEKKPVQAIDKSTAFVMNQILQTVAYGNSGTARSAQIGFPMFAKTGTTNNNIDRWMVGGTAQYVAAVWFGYKDRTPMSSWGGNYTLSIWRACMASIHEGLSAEYFPTTDTASYRRFCLTSGELATTNCSNTSVGVYKNSYTPACSVHGGSLLGPVEAWDQLPTYTVPYSSWNNSDDSSSSKTETSSATASSKKPVPDPEPEPTSEPESSKESKPSKESEPSKEPSSKESTSEESTSKESSSSKGTASKESSKNRKWEDDFEWW